MIIILDFMKKKEIKEAIKLRLMMNGLISLWPKVEEASPSKLARLIKETDIKVIKEYRLEISYNPPFFGPSSILLDHGKVKL